MRYPATGSEVGLISPAQKHGRAVTKQYPASHTLQDPASREEGGESYLLSPHLPESVSFSISNVADRLRRAAATIQSDLIMITVSTVRQRLNSALRCSHFRIQPLRVEAQAKSYL